MRPLYFAGGFKSAFTSLKEFFNGNSVPSKRARPVTPDGKPVPTNLKLEFAKAADYGRVNRVFHPDVKNKIDPNGFVVKRDDLVLKETIVFGSGAFLAETSRERDIHTMTMGYRLFRDKKTKAAGGPHDYTEIGTTITRLGGYNSAHLVVCALVLKEWWSTPPSNLIIAEIDPGNGPSIHTYGTSMGWKPIADAKIEAEVFKLCNEIIAPQDQGNPTIWYKANDASTLAKNASIVLKFMDQGGLVNKKTGDTVKVDFSALNEIGLSRKRLEAIAAGVTDKKKLHGPGYS